MRKCAVVAFFCYLASVSITAADPAFERTVAAAKTSALIPGDIVETARSSCETALCFAEALATALPDSVRLEPVTHPDADTIRRVDTTPSAILDPATHTLRLTHFGRKATAELREASAPGSLPVVDLRGNAGGDFERMLDIAGLLIGSRRDVVEIDYGDRIEHRSLDGPRSTTWQVTEVRIDEKTASAALLLARLLAGGGAKVAGPPPDEKTIFLKRRITIDHDWRLILPVAEVRLAAPGG